MVQGARIVAAPAGIDEIPYGVVDPTSVLQAWLSAMTFATPTAHAGATATRHHVGI